MQSITIFGLNPDVSIENRYTLNPVCAQDTIHVGTKLRNRLLNSSITLRLGNSIATIVHIKNLLNTVNKEEHGLVMSDIYPQDRQNFKSLEKIMHSRVISALENNIPDCNATVAYLKLCKQLTSCFVEENKNPIERIYDIWNGLYFLRCWRDWIQKSKCHTLAENFISLNAYRCIELNAHALVDLTIKLRASPDMFITPCFASQPCESVFRHMRSMGTQNFTKINFSLFELLHLTARVELMNKIAFSYPCIVFPRLKPSFEYTQQVLPSNEEIKETMKKALQDALKMAEGFGIKSDENEIKNYTLKPNDNLMEILEADLGADEESDYFGATADEDENVLHRSIEVVDDDGTVRSIPKSTLIWMLTESKGILSADRLKRVQGPSLTGPVPKRLMSSSNTKSIFKSEQLEIGQWGIFKTVDNSPCNSLTNSFTDITLNSYIIGFITGFRIITKNKPKQFKFNAVPIGEIENQKMKKKIRLELGMDFKIENVEVLAIFYNCSENGILHPNQIRNQDKFTLKIEHYFGTMKNPIAKTSDTSNSIAYFLPCDYVELKQLIFELNSHV